MLEPMRCLLILAVLASSACSAAAAEPEPIGETIWQTLGGFCSGPCPQQRLQRDGDALQLLRDTDDGVVEATGTWTEAGLAEYAAASAEAYPVRDDETVTCRATDGVDQALVLVHEGTTWTTELCLAREPPAELVRADALFDALVGALTDGQSHEHVEVD